MENKKFDYFLNYRASFNKQSPHEPVFTGIMRRFVLLLLFF